MQTAPRTDSPDLATRWQMFGQLLVVLARQLLRLERQRAVSAHAKAEQLELCVRAALVTLNRQIAQQTDHEGVRDPALTHMRAIALALLALAMFLQGLRARMRVSAGWGDEATHASIAGERLCGDAAAALSPEPVIGLPGGYFDSS